MELPRGCKARVCNAREPAGSQIFQRGVTCTTRHHSDTVPHLTAAWAHAPCKAGSRSTACPQAACHRGRHCSAGRPGCPVAGHGQRGVLGPCPVLHGGDVCAAPGCHADGQSPHIDPGTESVRDGLGPRCILLISAWALPARQWQQSRERRRLSPALWLCCPGTFPAGVSCPFPLVGLCFSSASLLALGHAGDPPGPPCPSTSET